MRTVELTVVVAQNLDTDDVKKIDDAIGIEHYQHYEYGDTRDVVYYVPSDDLERVETALDGLESVLGYDVGEETDDEGDEGDDPASEEPEEGDYTTGDHRTFYQDGKVVLRVPEGEDWEPHVRAHMEQEQFWPTVWFIDDHGGCTPLSLDN